VSKVIINADGLCEPNPHGVATWGFVAISEESEKLLVEQCGLAMEGAGATNNIAEYHAVLHALEWCSRMAEHLIKHNKMVEIQTDSQLVVQQVNGFWKCNNESLKGLKELAQTRIRALGKGHVIVDLKWVLREENEAADALSRRAYKEHTGRDVPERPRRQPTPGLSGKERYHPQIQKREKELQA
jgi:ribonuclease HI